MKRTYVDYLGNQQNVSSVFKKRKDMAKTLTLLTGNDESSKSGKVKKYKVSVKKLYKPKPEKKYSDVSISVTDQPSGTSSAACLNDVGQGSDSTQRVGRQIQNVAVYARLQIGFGASQISGTPMTYRVIFFIDTQSNGALPAASDLLQWSSGGTNQITSPLNLNNRKRFRIINDHTDTLDVGQGISNFEETYKDLNFITTYKDRAYRDWETDRKSVV